MSIVLLPNGLYDSVYVDGQIEVRVWDSSGLPIYTSSAHNVSSFFAGTEQMYGFNIASDHVQVSNSFYIGYQNLPGSGFGMSYMVDAPAGSNYGRSYCYRISDGTWSSASEDFWFDATVKAVPEPSTIVLLTTAVASALFMAWRRRKRS